MKKILKEARGVYLLENEMQKVKGGKCENGALDGLGGGMAGPGFVMRGTSVPLPRIVTPPGRGIYIIGKGGRPIGI